MHPYQEYSSEDQQLIRRCAALHTRSRSQQIRTQARSKSIRSANKQESLEDTRKFERKEGKEGLDEMSTRKKGSEVSRKNLIEQVSEFAIPEQSQEESTLFKSPNLKSARQRQNYHTPVKDQQNILQRIDQLKSRLEYRLYNNYRQLMKRPAYGKYITLKCAQPKQ